MKANEEIVEGFVKAIRNKEIEFNEVREILMDKSLPEEDIKVIVKSVDDELLTHNYNNTRRFVIEFNGFGIVLSIIGAVCFGLIELGVIEFQGSKYLSLGLILGGFALFFLRRVKAPKDRFVNKNKFK